jgi:hypothetical protein
MLWHAQQPLPFRVEKWKVGDVLGVLLDIGTQTMSFCLNGTEVSAKFRVTEEKMTEFIEQESGFYPAASLAAYQVGFVR